MDTTKDINTVEWFFGYGGNHLGLKRVLPNLRLLAACEIEEFAVENILAKMEAGLLEAAPIWSDCKTFPWEPFVDRTHLFVASYPCTPFSAAGKRQGAEDERHLWPYVYRWILRARPLLVLLENVEGHISLGLSTVISDLEEGGYKATWGIFSASEVGAPHQRKRVFILAHRNGNGFLRHVAESSAIPFGNQSQDGVSGAHGALADSLRQRGASGLSRSLAGHEGFAGIADDCGDLAWPSRPGEQQYEWEPPRVVGSAPQRQDHGREPGDLGFEAGQGPAQLRRTRLCQDNETIIAEQLVEPANPSGGQTQPSLGRDADGLTHRLDHAVLHVSTDNRTDELRLLGNGVVPATAERAFRVLVGELAESESR